MAGLVKRVADTVVLERHSPPGPVRIARHEIMELRFEDTRARVLMFLTEAMLRKGTAFVVATPEHMALLQRNLHESGGPVHWLDARKVVQTLTAKGEPDWLMFERILGTPIRQAAKQGPVYAYAETGALLFTAGRYGSALRLDRHWDRLVAQVGGQLLCAYPHVIAGVEDQDSLALQLLQDIHW